MHRRRFLYAAGGLAAGTFVPWTVRAQEQPTTGAAAPWIAALGHGFGIAVHDRSETTLDVCAGAGFGFVRTDLFWSDVETQRHKFDWQHWDPFVAGLQARALRPLFIFGFNNPDVYGGRWMEGVTTYIEMQAFTAFAAAAARRYRDAQPVEDMERAEPRQLLGAARKPCRVHGPRPRHQRSHPPRAARCGDHRPSPWS